MSVGPVWFLFILSCRPLLDSTKDHPTPRKTHADSLHFLGLFIRLSIVLKAFYLACKASAANLRVLFTARSHTVYLVNSGIANSAEQPQPLKQKVDIPTCVCKVKSTIPGYGCLSCSRWQIQSRRDTILYSMPSKLSYRSITSISK